MAFILTSSFAVKQLHELTSTYTLALPCIVEFGQHFIHELCSVRFWVWYPSAIFGLLPRTCVFNAWPLKFNTTTTQCLTTCIVEGTVVVLDFSLPASLSCGFAANSFLFLKNRFTSTSEKPER